VLGVFIRDLSKRSLKALFSIPSSSVKFVVKGRNAKLKKLHLFQGTPAVLSNRVFAI